MLNDLGLKLRQAQLAPLPGTRPSVTENDFNINLSCPLSISWVPHSPQASPFIQLPTALVRHFL